MLIENDFNIALSDEEEIEQDLLITESDSILLDQIRLVTGKNIDETRVRELVVVEAKKSHKNNKAIEHIIRNGFIYNNVLYKRLGKSASQSKDGVTVFISSCIYDEITKRSMLDINITKNVISKYEAQRCLIFSTCSLINDDLPYIVIVDEYEKIIPNQYIRYVVEKEKSFINKETGEEIKYTAREIEEGYHDVELSPFDGGGIHTLELSDKISKAIDLDYTAMGFQVRLPFMKGFSVAFNFRKYFKEVFGLYTITDVFGKVHNIDDVDCIWNTSMWKGYKMFKNEFGDEAFNKYTEIMNKYEYKLGISGYSHHLNKINLKARMNFQYLQCLDLWNDKYVKYFDDNFQHKYDLLDGSNDGKIIDIAKYTTNLFQKVILGEKFYTCKFLGKNDSNIDSSDNAMVKAILINDTMLKDVAIKQHIFRKLKKQIHQAKLGKIYCDGFYHTAIVDIIGYLEYCADKEVVGCLRAGELFADTIGYGKMTSFRSPLVCPSEVLNFTMVNLSQYKEWFKHLKDQDLVMYNVHDIALPQQGGMDLDGDAVYIVKNKTVYDSKIDKPIIININDKATAEEVEYNLDNIVKYEMATRDNRIGEITNTATCILNQRFTEEKWANIAYDNISLLRIYQGVEIDSVKSGFRWHLTKHLRNYLKQLPLFLLYNYPQKLNKYFRLKAKSKETGERLKLNGFKSPSPMNELCDYINAWERAILWDRSCVDTRCLTLNKKYALNDKSLNRQVKRLINEYAIKAKQIYRDSEHNEDEAKISSQIDLLTNQYKEKVENLSADKEEIANYVINISYSSVSMNKSFVWSAYSQYIIKNLTENSPEKQHYEILRVLDKTPYSMEFLGKEYEMRRIDV